MPEPSTTDARIVRFGLFELNLRSGELRKAGTRINLQEQPLRVLTVLLDRPGDLVTRDELRERLWPGDTFVDFDHGLNAVVNRLRDTLSDSADSPRFIETVPRRGYRFIAAVERQAAGRDPSGGPTPPNSHVVPHPVLQPDPHSTREVDATRARRAGSPLPASWIPSRTAAIVAVTVLALSAAVFGAWLLRPRSDADGGAPKLVPLTNLAGKEDWPTFAPDGEQVAFAWSGEKYDNADIYVTLVGALNVRRLTTDPAEDYAPSWSPDGRRIAFLRKHDNAAPIHVVSALGGPDAKVSDFPVGATVAPALVVMHITWSPDGRFIVAGRDPRLAANAPAGLHLIPVEGGEPRAITRPKRPTFDFSPAFSPDGRRLAYASCDTPGLFLPVLDPGNCVVRVVDVDGTFAPTAVRAVTNQPVDPAGLAWSRDGQSILFVGPGPRPVDLWRLWLDGSRPPAPIEIAAGRAGHPAHPARSPRATGWCSHSTTGAHTSIVSMEAPQRSESPRRRRPKAIRTSRRTAAAWRSLRVGPAASPSGLRQQTARTRGRSLTASGCGQARRAGRPTGASSHSMAQSRGIPFASGPLMRRGAHPDRSRTDPEIRRFPPGRRTVSGSTFRTTRRTHAIYGACDRRVVSLSR